MEQPRRGAVPGYTAVVGVLTSEIVAIPALKALHCSGFSLFAWASVVGTAGLSYWYWLTGVVLDRPSRLQRAISDYIGMTDRWFWLYWKSSHPHINRLLAFCARCAVGILIFLLGAMPFGLWIPGMVFCRTKNIRGGFWFLALGNMFKISYCILGLEAIMRWGRYFLLLYS